MDAYNISSGFFWYNFIFGLIFLAVTFLVSLFSYRIYRLTRQNQLKLFSLSFLCLSLAFLTRVVTDLITSLRLKWILVEGARRHEIREAIFPIQSISLYAYMLFFIGGLILLTYMTFKTRNRSMLFLLFGVIFLSLLLNPFPLFLFHILASVFFIIIVVYYYKNYKRKKTLQTSLVFIAFMFLLLGNLSLIFSVRHPSPFTMGRILELVAYLLILTDLVLIYKKKK